MKVIIENAVEAASADMAWKVIDRHQYEIVQIPTMAFEAIQEVAIPIKSGHGQCSSHMTLEGRVALVEESAVGRSALRDEERGDPLGSVSGSNFLDHLVRPILMHADPDCIPT